MTYTDVFGGALLFPSRLSYLEITTAVDVQLQWPTEQQIEGNNVVADFLDISTTVAALNVDFPDARNTSTGNKSTVNNIGGNNFTVRDATGGTIQVIGTGEQWVLVLTDNSTEAGTWSAFQLGAATTLASASALAGAGLQADGFGLLEQIIDSDVEPATPITVVDGDRAKCLIYTAGAGQCDLPSAGTVGNNWFFMLRNSGSGTLNIVPPSGNIDGASNINLDPNGSTFIFTDGADYYTIGLTVASTIAFDFVSIAVPGSGDFILTGANLDRISYRFTGALTGNRRIIVPNTTQQYWVDNQTSGAFTLEVTTAAGSGQTIPQSESAITYCDATDVINAVSSTSVTFPITISQGGTSATDAATALSNLGGAPETRLINTQALSGLAGGGDLTADRDLELDVDNLTVENSPDFATDTIAFYDDSALAMRKTAIENIGAIEVQDESVPLATRAQSLDFVGQFVTASGVGATKTISIDAPLILLDSQQIQFGTGTDYTMEFDGNFLLIQTTTAGANAILHESTQNQTIEFWQTNTQGGMGFQSVAGTGNGEIVEINAGGTLGNTYIDLIKSTSQVLLGYGNVPVARTAPVFGAAYPYEDTSGGFLVNNNTTGNGNNERVTTYADHQMTGSSAALGRNLTTTLTADTRLINGQSYRQGFYKFEIFVAFNDVGGTSNVVFDFAGTNLSECTYIYDYRSADGTPSGAGASDDAATNQTVNLGAASETTYVRISGGFRISANGGSFEFRWAPSVSQVDTVSRESKSWMTVCPIEVGV